MIRRLLAGALFAATLSAAVAGTPPLGISSDGRSLEANGEPFFWLGDTGWLMLSRLDREETETYLATRRAQGFNVIQVMVLHTPGMALHNGTKALLDEDPGRPRTTPGADPGTGDEYDYWDHLDWTLEVAEELGLYLALVPAWGDIAMSGHLDEQNAAAYGSFLAARYGDRPNIIWLNGGDTFAVENTKTWSILGRTLKAQAPAQLMTFHPRGRTDSSWTFHRAPWLDFNMFQSGHRSYEQDGDARGEDNWSYVEEDWAREPPKPVIDGEPSYENIPHDLHYADAPRWQAADARRYAWWSVLSGAFGHTYGENSVMQMYVPGRHSPAFHAEIPWQEALHSPGAEQMQFLSQLMATLPFGTRWPAARLVVDNGQAYERVPVLAGEKLLLAYSYTGRPFVLDLAAWQADSADASWYSPRNGEFGRIGRVESGSAVEFEPPGKVENGNDWVLVLRVP